MIYSTVVYIQYIIYGSAEPENVNPLMHGDMNHVTCLECPTFFGYISVVRFILFLAWLFNTVHRPYDIPLMRKSK